MVDPEEVRGVVATLDRHKAIELRRAVDGEGLPLRVGVLMPHGAYVTTLDLRSSTTKYRVLAWQKTWSTPASRTVKLVVVATSGRPRVDLDAFVTLR